MTVTAILEITVSAESVATAPALLSTVLAQTRAFPGNEGVEVLNDLDTPERFVVVEKWATIEDDEAYRAWRATPDGASELGTIVAAAPILTKLTSTDI